MQALPLGSTIGILGGGQLGRMLALAAARLGFKCHVYNDVPGPACEVAAAVTIGGFDDIEKLAGFAASVDVVTYEFENVPLAAAAAVERLKPLRPGPKALQVAQDRLAEKQFIAALQLPLAPFAAIEGPKDLVAAAGAVRFPAVLKTQRMGYDGKGQARVDDPARLAAALDAIGRAPATLESLVPFACEISVILVRSDAGETRFYDIPVNRHEGGILRTSTVPCQLSAPHQAQARAIAETLASALDYVGVLAMEMFHVDGKTPLLVNEFAPRVHNSGHWTIDACAVSQFENHIRAVVAWPLGATERHSDAEMRNLIGADIDNWRQLIADPQACLHLYGKGEARPGRKMGHVTFLKRR